MVKKWNLPRIDSKFAVIALTVLALLYFIVLPLAVLIWDSVMVEGTFDLSNYAAVYSQKVNLKALRNTVEISLLVMLLSVLITFPLAWLIGRTDLPGRKKFRTILVASYMIPPYVGAIAWTQLLNPDVGYLNQLLKTLFSLSQAPFNIYTRGGMIWVLTLFYSPFAFITIPGPWKNGSYPGGGFPDRRGVPSQGSVGCDPASYGPQHPGRGTPGVHRCRFLFRDPGHSGDAREHRSAHHPDRILRVHGG